jgi:hypothetical protein
MKNCKFRKGFALGILVCMLSITVTFPTIDAEIKNESSYLQLIFEDIGGCAGAIATGSVVKDGRSIFWKNRHMNNENNRPFFYSGPKYKYYGIGQASNQCLMGLNEMGLAVGNFLVEGPLENWEYISDRTIYAGSEIHKYLLGNFDNVYEAAMYTALHISGNGQIGIISSEPGVGAIVAYSLIDGICKTNITWINNTYAAIANAFYCDGDHDWDGNDLIINNMLNGITTNGGINGDFKIDWEEICQRGGKNVTGKEEGSEKFFCTYDISRPICVSGFVAVSGNPDFDSAANIGWLSMGRQPLVGIWLPLAASCLTETNDIPSEYRDGGGIEDFVDSKVFYATMGKGHGNEAYYCDRVREILSVTNSNESNMFGIYDELIDDIPPESTPSEVKSILYSYVGEMVPTMIEKYQSLNHPPDAPSIDGSTRIKAEIEYGFTFNSTDPDGNKINYTIDWGDGNLTISEMVDQGEDIYLKHKWDKKGTYIITAKSIDEYGSIGAEKTLEIIVPRKRLNYINFFNLLLDRFPSIIKILGQLL